MALDAIVHRKRPTWWQRFQQAPCPTVAQTLYAQRQRAACDTESSKLDISVVCVSDTHNMIPKLPPGDLLIHAGDFTQGGTAEELQSQLDWLDSQPHTYKVVIAGNHDIVLDVKKTAQLGMPLRRRSIRWGSIIYLEHTGVTLPFPNGVKVSLFGHPETRKHGDWAFQYDRGTDVFTRRVREGTDILITHSAPRFHLDVAGWGDEFLLRELWRVKPKLHIFGHIHEGYGSEKLIYDRFELLYEQVYAGSAGVSALLQMALLLLWSILLIGSDNRTTQTILVNASAVGGLRDTDLHPVRVVHL